MESGGDIEMTLIKDPDAGADLDVRGRHPNSG
jgi:hypothetical protein